MAWWPIQIFGRIRTEDQTYEKAFKILILFSFWRPVYQLCGCCSPFFLFLFFTLRLMSFCGCCCRLSTLEESHFEYFGATNGGNKHNSSGTALFRTYYVSQFARFVHFWFISESSIRSLPQQLLSRVPWKLVEILLLLASFSQLLLKLVRPCAVKLKNYRVTKNLDKIVFVVFNPNMGDVPLLDVIKNS